MIPRNSSYQPEKKWMRKNPFHIQDSEALGGLIFWRPQDWDQGVGKGIKLNSQSIDCCNTVERIEFSCWRVLNNFGNLRGYPTLWVRSKSNRILNLIWAGFDWNGLTRFTIPPFRIMKYGTPFAHYELDLIGSG